jgi:2'-5' RNA ligase
MPRLFTAVEIPEAIRLRLSLIRAPLGGAKWIEAENMHVTLRFAGDIDGRMADELVAFLADVRARPFPITIKEIGAFGGRDPRVLWAGVEAGEPLDALYRANERAARSAGLEPEGRAFGAHARCARAGGGALPHGERRAPYRAVHRHALRAPLGAPGHRRPALRGGGRVPLRGDGSVRRRRGRGIGAPRRLRVSCAQAQNGHEKFIWGSRPAPQ